MATVKKRVTKKKIILPKVMSKLIDIALRDIRKAEKNKDYVLAMDETWYEPDSEITCSTSAGTEIESYTACVVCAAGSVMAFTLKNQLPKGDRSSISPTEMEGNETQLQAIDSLRQGKVTDAYNELFSGDEDFPSSEWLGYSGPLYDKLEKLNHYISDYEAQDPEPFHKAMKTLQSRLAKAGL